MTAISANSDLISILERSLSEYRGSRIMPHNGDVNSIKLYIARSVGEYLSQFDPFLTSVALRDSFLTVTRSNNIQIGRRAAYSLYYIPYGNIHLRTSSNFRHLPLQEALHLAVAQAVPSGYEIKINFPPGDRSRRGSPKLEHTIVYFRSEEDLVNCLRPELSEIKRVIHFYYQP